MLALPSQEPEQATAQTGSHVGSGAVSHRAWQSTEQHCAQEDRHSPLGVSPHSALQPCWQSDMHSPMQLGGSDGCEVHAGTQLSWQVDVHEASAVAVQLAAHSVVSRAAHTSSTETGSHFCTQVSVGTTSHDAAAEASRYTPPHASRLARAGVTKPNVVSNAATPNETILFFVFMRPTVATVMPCGSFGVDGAETRAFDVTPLG